MRAQLGSILRDPKEDKGMEKRLSDIRVKKGFETDAFS